MSKLSQLVVNKIEKLGWKEAEIYFGRGKQALTLWKNQPNKIPVEAVEKVMDDSADIPVNLDETSSLPGLKRANPATVTAPAVHLDEVAYMDDVAPSPNDEEHEQMWGKLNNLNIRMSKLERQLGTSVPGTPDLMNSSVVPPKNQPVQGMVQITPSTPTPSVTLPGDSGGVGDWTRPHRFSQNR